MVVASEFFGRKVKGADRKKFLVFPRELETGGFSEVYVDEVSCPSRLSLLGLGDHLAMVIM